MVLEDSSFMSSSFILARHGSFDQVAFHARRASCMPLHSWLELQPSSLALKCNNVDPNFYTKLSVTRNSNPLEIKRAYKRMSLELHPDKNPSPNASDQFDQIKKAYDVLMDMELREVYNKFGKEGVENNKRYDETQFLLEAAVFYVTWGLMAFMLTLGKKSGEARNWTFTGLVVMMVLELTIMTSTGNPLPVWLFPTWTEHELIWLLHALFPAFMNGCRSLGSYLGGGGGHGGGGPRIVGEDVAYGGAMPRATPTGKIRELQDRLQASNTNVAQAVKNLKSEGSSSNMGFYLMILGYIVISYVFN
ncbi:hypothetical protein MHU86_4738 [Fragilaria crotonensis]|nr:hypothetical protein MHU86_4738 [Fragilaria crotonensis]